MTSAPYAGRAGPVRAGAGTAAAGVAAPPAATVRVAMQVGPPAIARCPSNAATSPMPRENTVSQEVSRTQVRPKSALR
jgi:hypothetical protein